MRKYLAISFILIVIVFFFSRNSGYISKKWQELKGSPASPASTAQSVATSQSDLGAGVSVQQSGRISISGTAHMPLQKKQEKQGVIISSNSKDGKQGKEFFAALDGDYSFVVLRVKGESLPRIQEWRTKSVKELEELLLNSKKVEVSFDISESKFKELATTKIPEVGSAKSFIIYE